MLSEGYAIESGPCQGECTCRGDGTWSCAFDRPNAQGTCELTACVEGGATYDLGSGWTDEDGCTDCQCTRQGIVCTDVACVRQKRCKELEGEYALAVENDSICDPTSARPQCVKRVRAYLVCDVDVPVTDTWEVEQVVKLYQADGCIPSGRTCPPHVPLGGHAECVPEGVCRDVL